MIEIKETPTQSIKRELVSKTCDVCKTKYEVDDFVAMQEFHHIRFTGGYGSIFGDESTVECDICQNCLYEMIKDFFRYKDE